MASIFKYPVKSSKYKYGYVVSNYPNKPKRKKGFRTKKEAAIEAKFIEDKLKLEKMHAKMTQTPMHLFLLKLLLSSLLRPKNLA